jgi:hypothetical protein
MVFIALTIGFIICYQTQQPLPEARPIMLRSIFYAVAIMLFPLSNLIRHIFLRLNQTMPLQATQHNQIERVAQQRYLLTTSISLLLMSSIGVLGCLLFMRGDSVNNLMIFSGLSVLGLFLYRPKLAEYASIVSALENAE